MTTSGVFTPDDATEMVNDLPLEWTKGPYYDEFSDQPPSQDPVPESEHKAENGERCTDSRGVPLRRWLWVLLGRSQYDSKVPFVKTVLTRQLTWRQLTRSIRNAVN